MILCRILDGTENIKKCERHIYVLQWLVCFQFTMGTLGRFLVYGNFNELNLYVNSENSRGSTLAQNGVAIFN